MLVDLGELLAMDRHRAHGRLTLIEHEVGEEAHRLAPREKPKSFGRASESFTSSLTLFYERLLGSPQQ